MRYFVTFTSFCLLVGCSAEEPPDTDWDPQIPSDAGVNEDQSFSDVGLGEGPGAGTMSGTWLQGNEGSTCVLGQEQVTHSYFLVDIQQTDRVLSETRRACKIQPSELLNLQILIPDEAREAIDYSSPGYGQINTLLVGGSYSSAQEIAQWGLILDDPILDPIPTDPDDPRVIDGDMDGNPALTFRFVGSDCERYTAQRQLTQYFGTLVAPNEVTGTQVAATDVQVYGSSQQLCGIATAVQPNDAFSKFRMVRVDGLGGSFNADRDGDGTVSCDEVSDILEDVMPTRGPVSENCAR